MMKHALRTTLFMVLSFVALIGNDFDCIEFSDNEVFVPARLGNLRLYRDDEGFHIVKNGRVYDVQNCFCDSMLRKMSNEQLIKFLGRDKPEVIMLTPEELSRINLSNIVEITDEEKDELMGQLCSSGYVSIRQMDDGEYILQAKVRLPGGGFWRTTVGVVAGTVIGVTLVAGVIVLVVVTAPASAPTVAVTGGYVLIQSATAGGVVTTTGGAVVAGNAAIAAGIGKAVLITVGGVAGGGVAGGVAGELLAADSTARPPVNDKENSNTAPQANNAASKVHDDHGAEVEQDESAGRRRLPPDAW